MCALLCIVYNIVYSIVYTGVAFTVYSCPKDPEGHLMAGSAKSKQAGCGETDSLRLLMGVPKKLTRYY